MSDQVEEVKQKVDIVETIGQHVTLKKAGRHYKGLCPFHSEKTPSFIVSPERQSFKCFGCGEGGDVITFLTKYDGMSFLEALEMLAKKVGITLTNYRPTAQDVAKKRMLEIMSVAGEFYRYLLTEHKVGEGAREYLNKRGIGKEASQLFGLGYAPKQWQGVSEYLTKKRGFQMEELLAVGLVIRSEGGRYYDRFRGRVMFPLRDHKGSVVGFSGRTLVADTKEAKYINSPETAIYHKSQMLYGLWENRQEIRKKDQLIIVEGELDVLPSYQAGVKHVVAIKGSAFTEEMGRLIGRYTKNVVYALDADAAGQEAIKRAVIVGEKIDLSIRVVQIVEGKDPGDVATADGQKWRELVKGATLYWDFLVTTACEKYDPTSGDGARMISQEVIPGLSSISNMVLRAHYAKKLAKILSVPEESIYEEIDRQLKRKELSSLKETVKKIEKGEVKNRRDKVEEHLLSLALQFYPQVREDLAKVEEKWFGVPVVAKIITQLKQYQGKWEIKSFSAKLPSEMQQFLDNAYLRDLSGVESPEKEWKKVEREVEEMYLKESLKRVGAEIAQAEKKGEEKVMEERQKEFRMLSRELAQL